MTAPDPASHWTLDPEVVFLNHGSFGACPREVLAAQAELRATLERQPLIFLTRRFEHRLDAARAELAAFLGADPRDLVFVPNATHGFNSVLRSLRFASGDELLTIDHAYNAARTALDFVAQRAGARVVVARIPFPTPSPEAVVDAVLEAVTPRTRLALLDHVTSPTGLVLPIARLVSALKERGVDTLVDGAHAPGMLPLELDALGAAYYTGNCHKWLCAPKGAGFLHVRRDRQEGIRPLAISHGANDPRSGRSRFHLEFDWVGTVDPTAYLCVPEAIRVMGAMLPGGWAELRQRNRALCIAARARVCAAIGQEPPAPETMLATLGAVPLPGEGPGSLHEADPLQAELYARHRIEVPVFPSPGGGRVLRFSVQLYNREADYEALAAALAELLPG